MDTPQSNKSFKSLIHAAKQENIPEVNVRLSVRQALQDESEQDNWISSIASLATPKMVSWGLAALAITATVSGVQFFNGMNSFEATLLTEAIIWF
ncbi:MAG: hypothetical protein ACPGN3_03365 [Opitutales bacterium]